jgi:hypothetical protein
MELVDTYVAVGLCAWKNMYKMEGYVSKEMLVLLYGPLDLLKRYREGRTLHPWDLGYVS